MTKVTWTWRVSGISTLLFVLGVGTTVLGLPRSLEWYRLVALRDRGETAPVQIRRTWVRTTGRVPVDVFSYDFQPQGTSVLKEGFDRVSRRHASAGNPAELSEKITHGTLMVRYLPDDIYVNRLDVFLPERIAAARSDVGLLMLPAAGLLGVGVLSLARDWLRGGRRAGRPRGYISPVRSSQANMRL